MINSRIQPLILLIGILFLPLLIQCKKDSPQPQSYDLIKSLTDRGLGDYLDVSHSSSTPHSVDPNWTIYEYATDSGPICLKGAAYKAAYRPGTINKAALVLEGGGACWDATTCVTFSLPAEETIEPPLLGILADNPDSPIHNWHVVYAGYCDGSVFAGNNDVMYGAVQVYHRGFQNLSAAIALLKEKIATPDQILITGRSAGGYGTLVSIAPTRLAFPEAPIYLLDDSGPGLFSDQPAIIGNIENNWKIRDQIPTECTTCEDEYLPIINSLMEHDENFIRAGLYSSYEDSVIRGYLQILSGAEYKQKLLATSDKVRLAQPDRFSRYMVNGTDHTIILNDEYYTKQQSNGSLTDWVSDLLDPDATFGDWLE